MTRSHKFPEENFCDETDILERKCAALLKALSDAAETLNDIRMGYIREGGSVEKQADIAYRKARVVIQEQS